MKTAITLTLALLVAVNAGCLDLTLWAASELIEDHRAKRQHTQRMAELGAMRRDLGVIRRIESTSSDRPDGRSSESDWQPVEAGTAWPQGSMAKRVSVRLSGLALGTAPHRIAFGVDLPREELEGAACLWMDNGVWIGDQPHGIKVLESPGLHRITALIVTKDDVEYCGRTTVQVLEPRGPPKRITASILGDGGDHVWTHYNGSE